MLPVSKYNKIKKDFFCPFCNNLTKLNEGLWDMNGDFISASHHRVGIITNNFYYCFNCTSIVTSI